MSKRDCLLILKTALKDTWVIATCSYYDMLSEIFNSLDSFGTWPSRKSKYWKAQFLLCINPFLPNPFPNVPFDPPWKHQKNFSFVMFSGGSKGNTGKKRVNPSHANGQFLFLLKSKKNREFLMLRESGNEPMACNGLESYSRKKRRRRMLL